MSEIDFSKCLVPVIVQDYISREVLMLAYMNREAYEKTLTTKRVTFFSRRRNQLWTKGETSGNFLLLKELKVDCDRDTILILAEATGPVCHTGDDTCFGKKESTDFIGELSALIKNRRNDPKDGSYVSSLFKKGKNKIAQKVGEEAVEVVIEAMTGNKDLFLEEASDLFFHYLVLLEEEEIAFQEVIGNLKKRHEKVF